MKLLYYAAIGLVFLTQWLVPANMIYKREKILAQGRIFKFLIEPVDPENPLTGRYLSLNFKEQQLKKAHKDKNYRPHFTQQMYILLEKDKDGFEIVKDVQSNKPADEGEYVKAAVHVYSPENDSTSYRITYPFENYYLDEYKAPKADSIFSWRRRDSSQVSYAIVSVLDGEAVIRDVMINGKSIREVIK